VLDPADGTARRRELIVRDGVITETRAAGDPRSATADPPPFDATGMLIVPGLINAHTHGHANVMKGVADRWPLEVSLTYGPSFAGPRDAEAVYCSTLLGAVEMLEKGITACYDLVYAFPRVSAEGLQAAAQAYADAGMRAVLAPMVADRTLFDAYPDLAASLPPARVDRPRRRHHRDARCGRSAKRHGRSAAVRCDGHADRRHARCAR
jgi:5-methylthioadenosine/S-adenosylhomocysteine deaminase